MLMFAFNFSISHALVCFHWDHTLCFSLSLSLSLFLSSIIFTSLYHSCPVLHLSFFSPFLFPVLSCLLGGGLDLNRARMQMAAQRSVARQRRATQTEKYVSQWEGTVCLSDITQYLSHVFPDWRRPNSHVAEYVSKH